MKEVNQVLIMAGGHGSRMSKEFNPYGCKSLIEYKGKTLISHLVDALVLAGLKKIIVATNEHSHEAIKNTLSGKAFENIKIIIANGNHFGKPEYAGVPYELRDILEDRFLIVCGHQPLTVDYIKKMIDTSSHYDNVCTLYENIPVLTKKLLSVVSSMDRYVYADKEIILKSVNSLNCDEQYVYIRNPYILTKDIVVTAYADRFHHHYTKYVTDAFVNNTASLGAVKTVIPPEFDYDFEYLETISFLNSQHEQH